MEKLLELYTVDYIKKSVMAIGGALLFGLIVMYPMADNIEERILYVNWSLYIALYGLFFYNYPLPNIVKWSMNVPVSKKELILFNIIFQIFKLFFTFIVLFIVVFFESRFIPESMLVSKIEEYGLDATSSTASVTTKIIAGEGVGTSEIMVLFLVLTFLVTFILNVSPYEPFRGDQLKQESPWAIYKYIYAKYQRWIIFSAMSLLLLYLTRDFYYSKAFLGGVSFALAMGLMYATYNRIVILPGFTHKYFAAFAGLSFVTIWSFFLTYSKNVSKDEKRPLARILSEWDFQGKSMDQKNKDKLVSFLERPNLTKRDIRKIVSLANGPSIFAFKKYRSWRKYSKRVFHPFENLDFKKVVLSKNDNDALFYAIKLFQVDKIKIAQRLKLFEKVMQNKGYNFEDGKVLSSYFVDNPFSSEEILTLIRSKNPYEQHLGINVVKKKKNLNLWSTLAPEIKNYNNELLYYATVSLSKYQCRTVASSDIINKKSIVIDRSSCKKMKKYRQILD